MTLQEDWKSAWKWLQVQLGVAIVVAPLLFTQVEAMREYIPAQALPYVMMGLGVLVVLNTIRQKQAA